MHVFVSIKYNIANQKFTNDKFAKVLERCYEIIY